MSGVRELHGGPWDPCARRVALLNSTFMLAGQWSIASRSGKSCERYLRAPALEMMYMPAQKVCFAPG